MADHPRVDRSRHRVRPGHRLRGRLRRDVLRHPGQAGLPGVRIAGHARHRGSDRGARVGHRRFRRRRGRRAVLGPDPGTASWSVISWTRAFAHRLGLPLLERLRLRRLALAHPHPADGQREPAARPGRRVHAGPDLRGGGRHLRGRRQVVVDRHAAVQLPVHRTTVLPDPWRPAGRTGQGRRLPGDHHRLLGVDGRHRRAADVPPGRRLQLRQGPAGAGGRSFPRLPVGKVSQREHPQRDAGPRQA